MRYWAIGHALGICVGTITFLVTWGVCIAQYGLLFGLGLGWLPALILGTVAHLATVLLWGPALVVLAIGVLLLRHGMGG